VVKVAGEQDTGHKAAAFGVGARCERGGEKVIEAVA
jgi:hypothetical protein